MAFNFPIKLTLSGLVMLLVVAGASGLMKPSFALTNGGSITAFGVPITEDFDRLATTGTNVLEDNNTIPACPYAAYLNAGGFFDACALQFRIAGAKPLADRALVL